MAIFNEILSARFARALQKLFSMKGHPPVKSLAGELVPMVSMFYGAECRYLEGWQRYAFLVTPAAGGVGNFNAYRLRNPVSSGVVAVVEKAGSGLVAGADQVFVDGGPLGTDLTVISSAAMRLDARGSQQTSLVLSNGAIAAPSFGRTLSILLLGANSNVDFILTDIQEVPLLPGDGFQLRSNTANIGNNFWLMWRERPLEDSEKT